MEEKSQFQIRGMAVLDKFQQNGIGNQLLLHAENYCKQQKVDRFELLATTLKNC
jgi:N-acetylglutamate synthase-like GNAT family acetyltransferase